jgi:Animal haem peroxidase
MKKSILSRPHGVGVRGATFSPKSPLFEGSFGRMFRALPPADFGDTDEQSEKALSALAKKMIADLDLPKDGPDPEESGIPSVYTYLGQFIDHDLTFDPASSLQKQNDPDALEDFRTPRFDLDNVYGRGPDDQPYFYAGGRSFLLGKPLSGAAANPNARDLPRSWDEDPLFAKDLSKRDRLKRRAIIGDPRNDENVIVSQLQGLFHRFHNKVSTDHPDWAFAKVQRTVRFHYQWIVLNDFLPTIVAPEVLSLVAPHVVNGTDVRSDQPRLEFFEWKNIPYMPLEFSAAAYRFGHSMVRPGYRLSETVQPLAIFESDPGKALTGFREFPDNWAIDWNLFSFLAPRDPDNATRTQLAYKIDTSLVNPLGNLPPSVAINPNILALRNLLRGWRMRLPSGQDVARAMGIVPLSDKDVLIGKFTGDPADKLIPITEVDPVFADNCPLWTYVLAETIKGNVTVKTTKGDRTVETRQLGKVGGRIVAETFVGLLLGDSSSYLSQDPLWTPDPKYQNAHGKFGVTELIRAALSA